MLLLLRRIILGFALATPVEPIGLLCVRRSLAQGWQAGFVSGLATVSATALGRLLATLAITVLAALPRPAAVIGGFLLCWMTYQTTTSTLLAPSTCQHASCVSQRVPLRLPTQPPSWCLLVFLQGSVVSVPSAPLMPLCWRSGWG